MTVVNIIAWKRWFWWLKEGILNRLKRNVREKS